MLHLRLIFVILAIPVVITAQISINNNDMPQAGDTIRLSSTYDFSGLDFTATGANYNWDFSGLQPAIQRVDTFVSIQQTPWVYQLIFFLSANLAKKQVEFDQIPGFEVTDVYEYYKNQSSDFRSVGFGVTLNNIPLPNKYNDPDIIYKFPLNYGNIDSSYASYGIDIPGIGYSGGWKKRVNQVDGWGTLSTPYGDFETIRLKSEVLQFDSLYIDSLGFGIPIYRSFTEYKWMGNNFGLPLLKVTDDGLLPSYIYIDSVRTFTTGGVDQSFLQANIQLFPNPTHSILNISIESANKEAFGLLLLNSEGKQVYSEYFNQSTWYPELLQIDLLKIGLKPGLYFALFYLENQYVVKKVVLE